MSSRSHEDQKTGDDLTKFNKKEEIPLVKVSGKVRKKKEEILERLKKLDCDSLEDSNDECSDDEDFKNLILMKHSKKKVKKTEE